MNNQSTVTLPIALRLLRALAVCLLLPGTLLAAGPEVIDFEAPSLGGLDQFANGSNLPAESDGFEWGGATFSNQYLAQFEAWRGWALSSDTRMPADPTEADFLDYQYSAIADGGAGGSAQFGIAFSSADANSVAPNEPVPTVRLPAHALPTSLAVTNVTYTALSMLHGDSFAKKFGGASGDDPDWLRLTIHARDSLGLKDDAGLLDPEIDIPPLASVDFYLADYRFEANSQDYLIDAWTEIDLTPLRSPGIAGLSLRLSSSDNSFFGMNTPAYVAVDDLQFDVAPPGDFNRDGVVDASDYASWRETRGQTIPIGAGADGTLDGQVTTEDLLLWQAHFGEVTLPPPTYATSKVPEPAFALLLLLTLSFQFATWRRI